MSDKLLINARWVVPVEPAGVALERHAVAVRGGVIEAVLPIAEAAQRYADYERVDLPGHALIPGLPLAMAVAAGVMGVVLAVSRDGWFAIFGGVLIAGDIATLPLLCVAILPAWLVVTRAPHMLVRLPAADTATATSPAEP